MKGVLTASFFVLMTALGMPCFFYEKTRTQNHMLQTCLLDAIYHTFCGGLDHGLSDRHQHVRETSVLGLSAFVLVCVHVGSEIGRFMFALLLPGFFDWWMFLRKR